MMLIKIEDLKEITRLSESKLRQMICEGQFPKPIKFGRAARWMMEDVEEWIRTAAKDRNGSDTEI